MLVHDTQASHALLPLVAANYLDLDIYHKPTMPGSVFSIRQPIRMHGDGRIENLRADFTSPSYVLVPLKQWWTEEYFVMGPIRSTKKQIILDVANKDGRGTHRPEGSAEACRCLRTTARLFSE